MENGRYDPKDLSQYECKVFVTENGSKYLVKGGLICGGATGGRKIPLEMIAGIDEDAHREIMNIAGFISSDDLRDFIAGEGEPVREGLYLIASIVDEKDRPGGTRLLTSRVEDIFDFD